MAKIHIQIGDLETVWDSSKDPLVILLTAEGNEDDALDLVQTQHSSKAVTKVKKSNDDSQPK